MFIKKRGDLIYPWQFLLSLIIAPGFYNKAGNIKLLKTLFLFNFPNLLQHILKEGGSSLECGSVKSQKCFYL